MLVSRAGQAAFSRFKLQGRVCRHTYDKQWVKWQKGQETGLELRGN